MASDALCDVFFRWADSHKNQLISITQPSLNVHSVFDLIMMPSANDFGYLSIIILYLYSHLLIYKYIKFDCMHD